MITLIRNIFRSRKSETDLLKGEIELIYNIVPQDFGGGCSLYKALVMGEIIRQYKLRSSLDIGVYRGRSLFPMAIAHKFFTKGIVYGVDPYTKLDANQNDYPELKDELDKFVSVTDFQKIYKDVKDVIKNKELDDNCILVRETSSNAVLNFKKEGRKFGLIHIDGNHDTKFVIEDVLNYTPLLDHKGFVVLDDVSWNSVKPAYDILDKEMSLVIEFIDSLNDFALFAKGLTIDEVKELRAFLTKLVA
ncbi:class I SAM-dependent methyltransferase [Snuella lapsa]|uniref:Class I SAM-dependent methyltransferase n=1 Tax=Snuella lapsa TaxID=870481 RepID=A0ABP6XUB0_9FLAO